MSPNKIVNPLKDLFLAHNFELCEERCDEEHLSLSFLKKDFRIEIQFDVSDHEFDLTLDRPYLWFNDSQIVNSLEEISTTAETFIKKIDSLILEDEALPKITKDDCDLFLKTGSFDGISSGVIEYQDSLYYIQSVTNTYHKHKSSEDTNNRVWRHFYVHEMTKEELEKVVMSSLDWLRHINLTSLCKNWQSLSLATGDEAEHKKYFDGKYRVNIEPKNKPVMKLTLFY